MRRFFEGLLVMLILARSDISIAPSDSLNTSSSLRDSSQVVLSCSMPIRHKITSLCLRDDIVGVDNDLDWLVYDVHDKEKLYRNSAKISNQQLLSRVVELRNATDPARFQSQTMDLVPSDIGLACVYEFAASDSIRLLKFKAPQPNPDFYVLHSLVSDSLYVFGSPNKKRNRAFDQVRAFNAFRNENQRTCPSDKLFQVLLVILFQNYSQTAPLLIIDGRESVLKFVLLKHNLCRIESPLRYLTFDELFVSMSDSAYLDSHAERVLSTADTSIVNRLERALPSDSRVYEPPRIEANEDIIRVEVSVCDANGSGLCRYAVNFSGDGSILGLEQVTEKYEGPLERISDKSIPSELLRFKRKFRIVD